MSTRLEMSPANWHGLDIFHNSQLTRYHDGPNLFPSCTPEAVQLCDVAHLDDLEADNEECAVSENEAARRDPRAGRIKWLVGFRGYAADSDLWIEDSQMNELLQAEARTRNAELLAEGERICWRPLRPLAEQNPVAASALLFPMLLQPMATPCRRRAPRGAPSQGAACSCSG